MSNKTKTKKNNRDQVPNLDDSLVEMGEQINNIDKYVVVRSGIRVSDKDYPTDNDSSAIAEMNFWKEIINRWPDGSKIEIVKFDKKKHRIW